jgi:hypothetical protein
MKTFHKCTVQFLPACALLACAAIACSSGNSSPATGAIGHGGSTDAAGTTGTGGALGTSGGVPGMTGQGGADASGAAAGNSGGGGQAGADLAGGGGAGGGAIGGGGAGGAAVNGGTDAGGAGGTTAKVYDLTSDWSDTQNPNGPWTVLIGTTVAKNVTGWDGEKGQNAYATVASGSLVGHIPALLKVSVSNFAGSLAKTGDLVIHAQDESGGTGLGQARIVWTAPSTGSVDVDASFWLGAVRKRKDAYTMTVAGAMKGMGDVPPNMGITRATPVKFSQKGLPIMKGETVELKISHALTCDACSTSPCEGTTNPTCAEFCGYTLKITHNSQ